MSLLWVYMICGIIILLLVVVALVISFRDSGDEIKMRSFECGFISFEGARAAFSLQFFLVAVVFLVFDVEIALILPLPVILMVTDGILIILIFRVFVVVVLGGLYYE